MLKFSKSHTDLEIKSYLSYVLLIIGAGGRN